jgi:hypothetical protein
MVVSTTDFFNAPDTGSIKPRKVRHRYWANEVVAPFVTGAFRSMIVKCGSAAV